LPPDDTDLLVGVDVRVPDCLLVAPHAGVFHRLGEPIGPWPADEPNLVDQGHVIGNVNLRRTTPVTSPVPGLLMGLLAAPASASAPPSPSLH
jgi:hypothetical protein